MIGRSDWDVFATNMLRGELKRKGVSHAQLAELVGESEATIRSKLAQGRLSAAFLLHCLSAIGTHELRF